MNRLISPAGAFKPKLTKPSTKLTVYKLLSKALFAKLKAFTKLISPRPRSQRALEQGKI